MRPGTEVVDDRQPVDEREILVHKSQAQLDRLGDREPGGDAPDPDLGARLGQGEAAQKAHEGGFARPVLAEQRIPLAAADAERGIAKDGDAAELLRDMPQLECLGAVTPGTWVLACLRHAGSWPRSGNRRWYRSGRWSWPAWTPIAEDRP